MLNTWPWPSPWFGLLEWPWYTSNASRDHENVCICNYWAQGSSSVGATAELNEKTKLLLRQSMCILMKWGGVKWDGTESYMFAFLHFLSFALTSFNFFSFSFHVPFMFFQVLSLLYLPLADHFFHFRSFFCNFLTCSFNLLSADFTSFDFLVVSWHFSLIFLSILFPCIFRSIPF